MDRVRQSHPTPPRRCHREWPLRPCKYYGLHDGSSVIWKLMSFTFAMITLPIGTYFFSVNFVFQGKLNFPFV